MGLSFTGISSLTTEIGVSPVNWYLTDSHVGSKDEMVAFIEDDFLRSTYVSSPTFELIIFLFACLCFHYTNLETHLHKTNRLQASQNFIAADRATHLHNFALTRYPCTSTTYTP